MIFSASLIVLFASLLAQGALAAPNGDAGMADAKATPSPASLFSPMVTPKGPAPIGSNPIAGVISNITDASAALNVAVTKVNPQQSVDVITDAAAVTMHAFADIVADLATAIKILESKPMISAAATDIIVTGFARFVKAHQALLTTVIARHNIFAQFALTTPLTAVLRANKAGIDAFASALSVAISSKKAIIQKQVSALDVTLASCVSMYSQVCRPSATFPKTQPKCLNP